MCSQNTQNIIRKHQENQVKFVHPDGICQAVPSNEHHFLLISPDSAKAEQLLKRTILTTFYDSTKRFENNQINHHSSASSLRSEKIQCLMDEKIGSDLAATSNTEYEKQKLFGTSVDTEEALFRFPRLVELEKSDFPFSSKTA